MADALELAILLSLKDQASSGLKGITDKLGPLGIGIVAAGGAAVAMGKALWDMGKMAAEEEQGVTRLASAVKNSGADWNTASAEIENYLSAELKRVALDDGEGRASLTRLTTATGSYKNAMAAMPSVIDLAAGANITLEQATQLVARGLDGNVSGLSKLIPGLEKGASATEIFAAINSSFGGSAEASADTFVGAQKKMDIALGNIKETIGAAVLPAMTGLMEGLGDLAMRFLPMVEAFIQDPFIPTLQLAKDWLGPKLQDVIGWIKDTGVPWAVAAFGAIQTFLEDPVTPTLRTIWNWLGPKIQDVIGWIKDTGGPWAIEAFKSVQTFLEDPVLPILKDIFEWLGPKVQGVITWVKDTGAPWAIEAFKSVQAFLADPVMPIIRELIDFLGPKLTGVISWFKDTGAPWLKGAFATVVDIVDTLVSSVETAIGLIKELTSMPALPDAGGGGGGGAGSGYVGAGRYSSSAAAIVGDIGTAAWSAALGVTALNGALAGAVTGGGRYGELAQEINTLVEVIGDLVEEVWEVSPKNPDWTLPIGPGGENWNHYPIGPGGEYESKSIVDLGGAATKWRHTPIGPGGEAPAAMEQRGASGIPWLEEWGPWPFGDFTNYEFNTQGYQQKYGSGPMGKAWYVRFAGWYRHGEARPNYWNQTAATGTTGGGGTGYIPHTPGTDEIHGTGYVDIDYPGVDLGGLQQEIVKQGGATYVLNYNAYRNEPGYNDAAYMLRILELYARLHG